MTNYSIAGRTYRYFDGDPLYPFGYGLSYTQFSYSDLVLSPTKVKAGQNVTVTFKIENIGFMDGQEVGTSFSFFTEVQNLSKLKEFADYNMNVTQKLNFVIEWVENDTEKRRKCWLQAFSYFLLMFSKAFLFRVV